MSLDVSESDSILRDKNVASTWHGGELKGNISHFDRTHEKKAINDNKIVTPNIASQNFQNQPPFSSSPAPTQNQTLNANNIQNSIPDIETQIKRTETGGGTCLICNKTYSKLFNCRKHFQETHVGNVPPTCSFCNKTYASSRSKVARNKLVVVSRPLFDARSNGTRTKLSSRTVCSYSKHK